MSKCHVNALPAALILHHFHSYRAKRSSPRTAFADGELAVYKAEQFITPIVYQAPAEHLASTSYG